MKTFFGSDRKIGLFTSVGMVAMAIASPAMAQDADEEAVVATEANPEEEVRVITVTGSRIRNPAVENLEPTQSLDEAFLQQRNFINAADALNELPLIRGSVTPLENQGSTNVGANFINIFGLGSQRSLTLINGRRVVTSNSPAGGGLAAAGVQVDINIINPALIERVDVVSIGGAPIYGSDAIAGTVNFILKDDYEGVSLGATTGISEEGDNFRYQLTGLFGTNFADGRGNVTFSGFYSAEDGILANARDFRRQGVAGCGNGPQFDRSLFINPNIGADTGPNDGNPGFVLCPNFNVGNVNQNGVVNLAAGTSGFFSPVARAENLTFNPDGTLRPYNVGIQNRSFFELGGDSFLFPDYEQITSDVERLGFNLTSKFEISPSAELFFEGMYFESNGRNLVEQPGFNSGVFGNTRIGAVFFGLDNPLLTDQARDVLAATGREVFELSRVNLDIVNTSTTTETQLQRWVGGIRGEFAALGERDWNYEVSLNYGRSQVVDLRQDVNLQNFVNGVAACETDLDFNVFPGSGLVPIADAACVPLSLFGFGTASDEAIDYATFQNRNESTLEQIVFNANIGGDLFNLFGNSVSFNGGYEYRREEGVFDADELANEGRGIDAPVADIAGSFEVNEVFGEIFVPLITPSNDFFINRLDVFGRGRYVDNSIAGGFFAWSAGGAIGFIPDITFRGNFTRSFRAPAIRELFSPQTVGRDFIGDFCDPGNRNAGAVPEIRNRNCEAFLREFPEGTPLAAQNASVPILQGGNPDLNNEEADSYTFGVLVQPRWVPNLAITVDYVDIEISQPIVNLSAANIAGACFDNEDFNLDDPANGNQFCSLIKRDSRGQVIADNVNPGVTTGFVNGAIISYEGIESTMTYRTGLDGLGIDGVVTARGALTYVQERIVSSTGVNVQRSDGTVGDPEFRGQLALQYLNDDFGFGSVINYTGEQLVSRFNRGPSPNDTREFDQYEDFVTVDFNVFFNAGEDFRFNFAVQNAFNRQGQEYFGFLIPAATNDFIGRRFTAAITKSF